jgi:hypothetical protein
MVRTLVLVALLMVWLALPLGLVFANGFVQDRWMLQESSRDYVAMVLVGLAWLLPIATVYLWYTRGHGGWRELAGLLAWAILTGVVSGHLFVNLVNHVDTAIGQPVAFKSVRHERVSVRLRAVGEAYDGVTFRYGVKRWRDHAHQPEGTAAGLVYRGRLGLYWGELGKE